MCIVNFYFSLRMANLNRKLNTYGLTMIAVGACIGAGIFSSPGQIVEDVPHHLLVIIAWTLGGFIALTGALTFSELGGMYPKSGGVYVYLKEAYGELVGFLYGWVILLVITTGAIAALGMIFAEYLTNFISLSPNQKVGVAAIAIILLTIINITGIQTSQIFANLFTGIKLFAIAIIIVLGFMYYNPEQITLDYSIATIPNNAFEGVILALIGVLFAMGGWHHTSFLSGETINPRRTVPKAMVLGVTIVTITYILVNIGYMNLLSLDNIAKTNSIAADAMKTITPNGGKIVAVAIAISIFGTIGIYTMSAPRIYYAMAKDGVFFKFLSEVHPRYKTPAKAMIFQSVWAIVLLLMWGQFRELMGFVVFMDIIFMTLAGASVFVLRKKRPEIGRPIKVWMYPIVPAFFVVISTIFVLIALWNKHEEAISGLIILGIGILVYYLFFKNNKGRKESEVLDTAE